MDFYAVLDQIVGALILVGSLFRRQGDIYRTMDMIFWLLQAEAALAQIEERPE